MFTQRHYTALADVLSRARFMQRGMPATQGGIGAVESLLLDLFEGDNPNFHTGKFLAASTREHVYTVDTTTNRRPCVECGWQTFTACPRCTLAVCDRRSGHGHTCTLRPSVRVRPDKRE